MHAQMLKHWKSIEKKIFFFKFSYNNIYQDLDILNLKIDDHQKV